MKPTLFEKMCIEFILAREAPDLLHQIAHLEVCNRCETGVGVLMEFANSAPPVKNIESIKVLGDAVVGEREDLPDVLRFVLEVYEKDIISLEMYLNSGDEFPEFFDSIRLSYI